MNRFVRIAAICILGSLLMGGQCQNTETVILPEGPATTALGKTKDQQIVDLKAQVKGEEEARALERAQAGLVAANLDTILFITTGHIDLGLPRTALEEEAKLGLSRSPPPDPTEIIKGKDRAIAILTGEVEKAKSLYDAAKTEAQRAKELIAVKDGEIVKRDDIIKARERDLVTQTAASKAEMETHKADVKKILEAKDDEIKRIKDEQASKERRWIVMATRISSLGLIVAGVLVLALFKMPMEGASIAASGVLVGLISIFIEWLTAQAWFYPVCLIICVFIVISIGYFVYRTWLKHSLSDRKTQAIQDLIDEATIKGDMKTVDELKAHLSYRIGDKTSFFGRKQMDEVAALGLVNPAGEAALKVAPTAPTTGG